MPELQYARLSYSTGNLGDDLQTEATLPFLANTNISFDRDKLATIDSKEKYIIIMNGWWSSDPQNSFPPAHCFIPVFIGFHIAKLHIAYFTSPHCIEYFKQHEPIGCRDTFTQQQLDSHGVKTFFSGCLTTTFEKRNFIPIQSTVYLVDTDMVDHLLPHSIRKTAKKISHQFAGEQNRRKEAVGSLLKIYHEKATLVITSRLHAALTCCAIGVPVVYFSYPEDARISSAEQIGLKVYRSHFELSDTFKKFLVKAKLTVAWRELEKLFLRMHYRFVSKINWNPDPLDIEMHKSQLRKITREQIAFKTKAE